MSGVAEALAILPLITNGIEKFHTVARPFRRYKKFGSEAKAFRSEFKVQDAFYRTSAELLLSAAVGYNQALEMIENPTHDSWTDEEVDYKIGQSLGSRREACISMIGLIEDELLKMKKLDDSLGEILAQDPKASADKGAICKEWRSAMTEKVKMCLSMSTADEKMDRLRRYNQELHMLVDQSNRVTIAVQQELRRPPVVCISREDHQRFKLIQRTSKMLYECLGSSCTLHSKHLAHLNLSPKLTVSRRQVHFDLAFRQSRSGPTSYDDSPLWLAVESAEVETEEESVCGGVEADFKLPNGSNYLRQEPPPRSTRAQSPQQCSSKKSSLKRRDTNSELSLAKRFKSKVGFANKPSPDLTLPLVIQNELQNLCQHRNFCTRLSASQKGNSAAGSCVGFLQSVPGYKHLIYVKKPAKDASTYRPLTLSDFFSSLKSSSRKMLLVERVRFARCLATAVLQFHATPWLKHGLWRSEDICILPSSDTPTLTEPFIELHVQTDESTAQTTDLADRPFRNPLLFGLALILIELAYKRPFKSMMIAADGAGRRDFAEAEYYAAMRLSGGVDAKTVPAFKRVVERCLYCNFAVDPDLTKTALQEVFYSDVVCELQRVERVLEGC